MKGKITMPKAIRELSWTPRSRGNIYCSSACGHGCKRADYEKAVASAEQFANGLGRGWKPRVWENMGWHWSVSNGEFRISPSGLKGRYTVYLNPTQSVGGTGNFFAGPATPRAGMEQVLNEARSRRDALNATIEKAEKVLLELMK
jgi:hypothetical protein